MALELNGTTGVSLVQDGVITDANLPAGSVLQVVQGTTNTPVTVASTSYTDTGLSGTITPASATSKILVTVNQHTFIDRDSDQIEGYLQLFRGATSILEFSRLTPSLEATSTKTKMGSLQTFSYLDSPSTTSAITYKTQGRASTTANNGQVIYQLANTFSIITLMEIAG